MNCQFKDCLTSKKARLIISWPIAVWTAYIFVGSLFYKFSSNALEPKHIFDTIGAWMSGIFGQTVGDLFAAYGGWGTGIFELVTAIILLLPIVFRAHQQGLHFIGGMMASGVMTGAVFFHLFTPLGWHPEWKVNSVAECAQKFISPDMCADTGLANAALSILLLGFVMMFVNRNAFIERFMHKNS